MFRVDERVQTVDSENKRISGVNKLIRDLASRHDNTTFLDAGDMVRGADNNLK